MKGKLICYTLGEVSSTLRNRFKRELVGYKDYSNMGKYNYERGGLLSNIPNYRPIRSVIIIKEKDKNKIVSLLKRYKARYNIFDVNIRENLLNIKN